MVDIEQANLPELQESFRRLQRRDWELWSIALLLLTLFAGGVLAYLYSQDIIQQAFNPAIARFSWFILFGLVVLVVLLNIFLIERKRALHRLWRHHLIQAQELEKERLRAVQDPLTEVYNRRFFEEVLPGEAQRCDRFGRPLSFLLVDVDNFREINKQLGHFVADTVLQDVAQIIKRCARSSDLIFRFGSDEFLLALPDASPAGAALVQERLQRLLAEQKEVQDRVGRPLTASMAVATYQRGQDLETMVEAARRKLDSLVSSKPQRAEEAIATDLPR